MYRRILLTSALLLFLIMNAAVLAQFEDLSLRDQIIINTQRLNRLERSMDQITDANISRAIAILENRLVTLEHQFSQQRTLLYNVLLFAVVQFMTLVVMGVKAWLGWLSKRVNFTNNNHADE